MCRSLFQFYFLTDTIIALSTQLQFQFEGLIESRSHWVKQQRLQIKFIRFFVRLQLEQHDK